MPDPAGVNVDAVERWFGDLGIEFAGPLAFERIGIGQSNLTYLVSDAAERRWVLRRPPLGHLLASAHDVAREARILSALHDDAEVATPRVYGLTQDPELADVPVLLMEYIDGLIIDRMAVAEALTPRRRRAIGLLLPGTLAKIHAVDLEATGLSGLASHTSYARRQLKRWAGQWEASKTRELPGLDELTERLLAAAPEQRELALVHGDFHLCNVIFDHGADRVVATLDWELSTLGDPLADMGALLAYWTEAGETIGGDFNASGLEGFPNRAEMAQAYLDETGRDPAALRYWHAFGLWRIAVIAEGVMRRARDEPQNRAAADTPTVEHIDALVAEAREVAAAADI